MGRHSRTSATARAAGGAAAFAAVAASIGFPGPANAATSAGAAPQQPGHDMAPARETAPGAPAQDRTYTVRPGDYLSKIAGALCANTSSWRNLAEVNHLANPDRIFPGQKLRIACHAALRTVTGGRQAHRAVAPAQVEVTSASGVFSCSALEALWEEAGGAHAEAFMAAEIAQAESGGRSGAISPTDDWGLWQINGSHGPAEATLDPLGNARAAVAISDDGRDWDAWTTFRTGAYAGRC